MWLTNVSLLLRILVSFYSIVGNGWAWISGFKRTFEVVHPYKLLSYVYLSIPFTFIIFSALELFTLNVHITDLTSYNFVGLCATYFPNYCATAHGWQMGCYLMNMLIVALSIYHHRQLVRMEKGEITFLFLNKYSVRVVSAWLLTVGGCVGFGFWFSSDAVDDDVVPTDEILLGNITVISNVTVHFEMPGNGNVVFGSLTLFLGIIYTVTMLIFIDICRMLKSDWPPSDNDSDIKIYWCGFYTLFTMLLWPLTAGFYLFNSELFGYSIIPVECVMMSFNLVSVIFPLIDRRTVARIGKPEQPFVMPPVIVHVTREEVEKMFYSDAIKK